MTTKGALSVAGQLLVWQAVLFFVAANTIGVFVFMVGHQRGPLPPAAERVFFLGWAAILSLQGFAPLIVSKLSPERQAAFARANRGWLAAGAIVGPLLGIWLARHFATHVWRQQLDANAIAELLLLVLGCIALSTLGTTLWRASVAASA